VDSRSLSQRRYSENEQNISGQFFSLISEGFPAVFDYQLTGTLAFSNSNGADVGSSSSREVAIENYGFRVGSEVVEDITNSDFELTRTANQSRLRVNQQLEINGRVKGSFTQGHTVVINSNPGLSKNFAVDPGIGFSSAHRPFSGQVDFASDDNSFGSISANPTPHPDESSLRVLVDSSFTLSDGTVKTRTAEEFDGRLF